VRILPDFPEGENLMDKPATDRVLLVDLENVQKVDLAQVPVDAQIMIFYGITQKKLPEELVVQAQPFGPRLKWVKIAGQGPNALDFHIAFYLGQIFTNCPAAECAILSRDTGFAGKVKSWFPDLTEDARLVMIQRLFDQSAVREAGKVLTYEL
jgi:hypothetical protein